MALEVIFLIKGFISSFNGSLYQYNIIIVSCHSSTALYVQFSFCEVLKEDKQMFLSLLLKYNVMQIENQ